MPRARKKKAKPARKRAAKRTATRRKTAAKTVEQSQSNWQMGAGILALALILGAGVYMIGTNDGARNSVANFVERMEVPESVKNFPDTVKQNLPEMPSLTKESTVNDSGNSRSAPAQ